MSHPTSATARIVGALLGTLPGSLLAAVALSRCLPVRPDVGLAIGLTAAFPLWVAAMTWAFLVRTAARVWVAGIVGAALLAVAVHCVG